VIGDTLYVPETWGELSDLERVILLRHEPCTCASVGAMVAR